MSSATVEIVDPRDRHQYSISDLSDEFKVTARALRFYEDEGLISPIRRGLTRIYTKRDRARLAWILRAKRVGFSLADIREMFRPEGLLRLAHCFKPSSGTARLDGSKPA